MIPETENVSIDVQIMKTVPQFDYLIKEGEKITLAAWCVRARNVPAIMDEPDLQIAVQSAKESTIKTIHRNSLGYWYDFEQGEAPQINDYVQLAVPKDRQPY